MIFCNYDPMTGGLSCESFKIDHNAISYFGSVEKAVDWMLAQVRACLIAKGKDYDRSKASTPEASSVEDRLTSLRTRVENLERYAGVGKPVEMPDFCPRCGRKGSVHLAGGADRPGCSCGWRMSL